MSDPSLNILYLLGDSDRGESAVILAMHEMGMRVRVFGHLDSRYVQRFVDAGIPVTNVRWGKRPPATLRLIRRTVAEHRIDIIHTGTSRTTMYMVLATKGLRRPPKLIAYLGVIGNVHWWSPVAWVRFLNPRIDRVVCVAEGVRRYLLAEGPGPLRLDPRKVVTIHKGHKLEWYREQPADLAEFGIPPGAMTVVVASRLRPRKGLVELVRALGLTDPARSIHLLFLGHDGNDEMREAIAALPHPDRVHFAGFRPDAPAIAAACDVCCLPVLHGEGLSRAIIEGMAYGVCPLVTAVSGNTELVVDGECGLVVPPGDEPALARAMERLHDDPPARRRMAAAARERIATRFHSDETVRKTLALYRELMNE